MGTLPRMALTYPLMIRYYEALFSGELGFELVAQFHGDPRLGVGLRQGPQRGDPAL